MGFMRIHCDCCGRTWEVYHRDITASHSRKCPHCGAHMDEECYRQAVNAYQAAALANHKILQKHVEQHFPIFTIDFIDTSRYANRYDDA